MISDSNDFITQYKAISTKIKKRFLRKPNIAEASADFNKLAKRLTESEAWIQASLCSVAVARCEQTLANPSAEASALVEAARNYMKAEKSCEFIDCPSYNEHLISSISCFQHAIKVYCDQRKTALAAALAMELSIDLCSLGRPSEALTYFNEASYLLINSPLDYLTCLNYIASCKLELGDLEGALKVFTQVCSTINKYEEEEENQTHIFEEMLSRCEISSLLILLAIQPLPNQMKPEYSSILEKFSAGTPKVALQDPGLAVCLQSLVLACQARDLDSLSSLASLLTQKFAGDLLLMLHILITEMNRS